MIKYVPVNGPGWENEATYFPTKAAATRQGNRYIDEHGGYYFTIPDKGKFLVAIGDAGWLKKVEKES